MAILAVCRQDVVPKQLQLNPYVGSCIDTDYAANDHLSNVLTKGFI